MKKIIISILIIIILAGLWAYRYLKGPEISYETTRVERGNVIREVSATGKVVPDQEINLEFEVQGRIKQINVETGQKVEAGDVLALLDDEEFQAHVQEAEASLKMAEAKLEKLLVGASAEEIKIKETAVANAEIALLNAKQNLKDIEADAQKDLSNAYEDVLNTLDDSYIKIYNAYNQVDLIQRTYFDGGDQISVGVQDNEESIKNNMSRIESFINTAKISLQYIDIDTALLQTKNGLTTIFTALAGVREACNEPGYKNTISSTEKTNLDTQKTNINTAITNIVNDQQTISSTKVINQANINTAEAGVASAEGNLTKTQDELALIKAEPRRADTDLAEAEISQAKANLTQAKKKLSKTVLKTPTRGVIIDVEQEIGEMSKIGTAVISMISLSKFQIEADTPETDIGKISLQDLVEIDLDAFPEEIWPGKVISIDPAETIVQGVVYYRVVIEFEQLDKRVKSGMTANIIIQTDLKENVLVIPQRALIEKNEKKFVRMPANNGYEEKEVEVGLRGSNGEVEIISGIKEGEEIITFLREK